MLAHWQELTPPLHVSVSVMTWHVIWHDLTNLCSSRQSLNLPADSRVNKHNGIWLHVYAQNKRLKSQWLHHSTSTTLPNPEFVKPNVIMFLAFSFDLYYCCLKCRLEEHSRKNIRVKLNRHILQDLTKLSPLLWNDTNLYHSGPFWKSEKWTCIWSKTDRKRLSFCISQQAISRHLSEYGDKNKILQRKPKHELVSFHRYAEWLTVLNNMLTESNDIETNVTCG